MRSINVGLAGFVEVAEANGWELVPTISAAASPSAHVAKDAFERVMKEIVDGMRDELARVARDPDSVFFYSFVQARARV